MGAQFGLPFLQPQSSCQRAPGPAPLASPLLSLLPALGLPGNHPGLGPAEELLMASVSVLCAFSAQLDWTEEAAGTGRFGQQAG